MALPRRTTALLLGYCGPLLVAGCQPESPRPADAPKNAVAGIARRSEDSHWQPSGQLPAFREFGGESGFDFQRYDDIRGLHRILEANGGGVGLFDFDRDGWLDIVMTNGCRLPLNVGDRTSPCGLFHNRGAMQFANVTAPSELHQFGYTCGVAVGDYDADGFDDLYITAVGPDALWHNDGDGTFSDVSEQLETNVTAWGTSAAFADVNGDGHLDLYVVNYLADSDEHPRLCPNAASPDGYEQCAPALYDGVDDVLFLSDGMGRLIDATAAAGLAGLGGNGLGVVISDLDGDGRMEIFVANDGEANFLLVQEGVVSAGPPSVPRFVDRALSSGVALNEAGFAQANMGIAAGDYDANGTTDFYITTFFGDAKTLFSNRGGLYFDDASRSSRLGPTGRDRLGFGTVFLDADNDGWLDLFVANGHVDDRTWMPHSEPYRMRPQFYRNERGGTMLDVSEWSGDYFQKEWLGRGVASGDLDRDGRIDLVVSHQLAPSLVLRNETETDRAALTLRLVGVASNRNGYGARVEYVAGDTTIVREVLSGGSFQSASAPVVHLGLGLHPKAAVQVRWPSGIVETFHDLTRGEWILIEGGQRVWGEFPPTTGLGS